MFLLILLISIASSFYTIKDGKIIDESTQKEFHVKGIGFTNNCYDTYWYEHPKMDHTNESYSDVFSRGFNSVRFYMNSKVFQADDYSIRPTAWPWLDNEISQAKKAHIKLILNMHLNQEGYASQGKIFTPGVSQNQFFNLWALIAEHCKDEETVLGFGLINEPNIQFDTNAQTTLQTYQDFIETTVKGIRQTDNNHLIFLETVGFLNGDGSSYKEYGNLFTINDSKTVYESHYYSPIDYTHQNASFNSQFSSIPAIQYSEENYFTEGKRVWKKCLNTQSYDTNKQNTWQKLSATLKVEGFDTNEYFIYFWASNMKSGYALFDDFTITEKDGESVVWTKKYDFNSKVLINYWSSPYSGSQEYSTNEGRDGSGAYKVSGVTSTAQVEIKEFFYPTSGRTYTIEGYVYGTELNTDVSLQVRMNFETVDYIHKFDKEYLEHCLQTVLKFQSDKNVPIYIGEFGITKYCFWDRQGEKYVEDFLDICEKHNLNFNYHDYHDDNFGLYQTGSYSEIGDLNKQLDDVFQTKLPNMWKSDEENSSSVGLLVLFGVMMLLVL
ncbi:hypothetical protein EIN_430220 [Entamoeba invadens IP1]|uniref:Glycoside hydrolase family 5 domain-containing protein n=1 Tax=Entamoeba invadens IP1 TaxID=370355 RepID=A0A0A1UF40_ENTIV|nr:hypothetical protein EIN_430220 [Entamoeba invadens IP1]ELP95226.1 hypothetical protein EIN_430220 [Entamoeba invadens IP1]|eukprot:XP_004261997.1 hypothetical protein EIN_430220 [Entamoeba invadens IP1]